MKNMQTLLIQQKIRYESLLIGAQKRLRDAPKGNLRISTSQGQPRYFLSINENGTRTHTYLPKTEQQLIQKLAQKDYDKKLQELAQKRVNQFKYLATDYEDNEIESLFTSLHPARQALVTPAEPTSDQLLAAWQQEAYPTKGFPDNTSFQITDKGEQVRSKSEKILADYFYRHGIPYLYEKPLVLKGYGTVYPDFTFFSTATRKEIYWEHLGRMDDPDYAEKAIRKILTYERNGILPGDRLLLTYETGGTPLTTEQIEFIVNTYIL